MRLSATGAAAADRDSSQRAYAATTGGRPGWDSSEQNPHARLRTSPAAKGSLRPTAAAAQLRSGLAANSSRSAVSAGKTGGPGSNDTSGAAADAPGPAEEEQGRTAASSVLRHGRFASRTAPVEVHGPSTRKARSYAVAYMGIVLSSPCLVD